MRIKIRKDEYEAPFTCDADYDNPGDWIRDANENPVDYEDATAALNELSSLRQERDALLKRVAELEKENDELRRLNRKDGEG